MTHRSFKGWLLLSLYDELSEREERLLEEHLLGCASCRTELDRLKRLHQTLEETPRAAVTGQMLREARRGLRAVLRYERARRPLRQRIAGTLARWGEAVPSFRRPLYSFAFGGAALFFLGLALGRGMAPGPSGEAPAASVLSDADLLARGDVEISNVRFLDADASDGGVEFAFEVVRPMHIKGPITDPRVQKVLAYALVNEQNPGVRLRAVNTVAGSNQSSLDPDIKTALITALKYDPNPGVRREAFASLMGFPFDPDIKKSLLYVLTHDRNAGLRIKAINTLGSRAGEQRRPDQAVVDVLRARMESDENAYIRSRARTVLQQISQPQ